MSNKFENGNGAPMGGFATRWDEQWVRQYGHLVRYRLKYKDTWPSTLEEFPKGNRLGQWAHRQRDLHGRRKLEGNRVKLLNKLNFPWDKPDERESHWMRQFQYLKEYRRAHPGEWPFAREEYPKGNRLGLWCHLQRCAYKADKLEAGRASKLNRIGFQWSVKNLGWMRYYEMLKDYKKKHPAKWPTLEAAVLEDKKLISWCSAQRHKRKLKKLDKEKIELLNKLGFRW